MRPDGEAIAAFDMYKADLLDYVFEKAKAADKLNWKYVDGLRHKRLKQEQKPDSMTWKDNNGLCKITVTNRNAAFCRQMSGQTKKISASLVERILV